MADEQKKERTTASDDLFAAASLDPSSIPVVGDFVRVGRRWDMTHKDLLDKVVIIHQFTPIETRFGQAYLVDLDVEGEEKTVLFGGEVLKSQLSELAGHLPVLAVVSKPSRAYVMTNPSQEQIDDYKELYL